MRKGEKIILKDDKGKQYELIRGLDLDTKKIIDDLSALVVKKDKIIDKMAEQLAGIAIWNNEKEEPLILISKEEVIKYFEERCK
jgi:hypothetical protein